MTKLVFLQRTPKEVEIFGGDVYFDIDGKNMGKLALINQVIELPAGEHTVKMYKSHTFDTFIGFAESTINLNEGEILMVKYSCPMMVNLPGNMVISEYSEQKEMEALRSRNTIIEHDFVAAEMQKKEAEEKYKNGVLILISIAVAIGIFYGIVMALIY